MSLGLFGLSNGVDQRLLQEAHRLEGLFKQAITVVADAVNEQSQVSQVEVTR